MPEIPDLEVIKDFLNERIAGREVVRATAPKARIVRSLAAEHFEQDVVGRRFGTIRRIGKDLLFPLDPDRLLVANLMLTGRFQYTEPSARVSKQTFFTLGTADADLRYLDGRSMGRIHYVRPDQLDTIARLQDQGPDALDGGVSYEEFKERLRPYTGEIKGVLARGKFLAGIGNAYVDEILWEARVSPFRKRGGPCPRCGTTISEITPNQRITSWCRTCQPGQGTALHP